MNRHYKAHPSKAAQEAYRQLLSGDDAFSRLEKGACDLEALPAIDLYSPPELDQALPEADLSHDTGEEPTR